MSISYKLSQSNKDSASKKLFDVWKKNNPTTEVDASMSELAMWFYNELYDEASRELMNKSPDGMLVKKPYIRVRLGSYYETRELHFDSTYVPLSGTGYTARYDSKESTKNLPIFAKHNYISNSDGVRIEELPRAFKDEFYKRLAAHEAIVIKYAEKAKDADSKIKTTVNSFSTYKQAIDSWPEIKPYLPTKTATVTALAVVTEDLNKLVGLPEDTKE